MKLLEMGEKAPPFQTVDQEGNRVSLRDLKGKKVVLYFYPNDYGVWGEKSLYGRKFMGTNRVTYIVDEKGKVAAVWPRVKPEGHAAEILAAVGKP